MTTRRQDLDLIEDVVRRSTQGNVKHHEVSQALMALERLELDRYEKPQPATK